MTRSSPLNPGGDAGRGIRALIWSLLLVLGLALAPRPSAAPAVPQAASGPAAHARIVHLDGAIGPASAGYLSRSLAEADAEGAALVILRIDTPGGLDTSMRAMIREIIASPVPVATWVAPGGARAASAGTYILYASHVAAMAPGTNLGAATPVQLGGAPGAPGETPAPEGEDAAPADKGASEAKAVNDAVAYIRSLADLRGRNADWAERAVREAASLDAREALRLNVIDIVAADAADLLAQSDGRTVTVAGSDRTLQTVGLRTVEVHPAWRDRILSVLTNPNIALLLMMIGVYGLIFEFMNPGAIYPGAIGAICLIAGLYALAVLPLNYAGLALIGLGLALMVAEGFAPSFGALGITGGAAFIFGAMILIDTGAPGFGVSIAFAAGLAVAGLAFSLLAVRFALSSRRRRIVTGREEMIGASGVVQDWNDGAGHVFAHRERWRAVSAIPLTAGDRVTITELNGLTLTVVPAGDGDNP